MEAHHNVTSVVKNASNVNIGENNSIIKISAERPTTSFREERADFDGPGLSARETSELAKVFCRPAGAAQVLAEAGIPPSVQPSWQDSTAEEFWEEVRRLVEAGIVENGASRILTAASRRFPANRVFNRSI